MDIVAILALVAKGITVATALLEAGQSAAPALAALTKLVTGAQTGAVTKAQLDATEAVLDSLIADFNVELPPAQPGDPDFVKAPAKLP